MEVALRGQHIAVCKYYFDTLFPRIPVPVLRTVVGHLERMKLPTKHAGVTGDTNRCSEDTARRPPSVKAALSVSFGQRAPHRASTRDSSPVRRTLPTSQGKKNTDELRKASPSDSRHEGSDRDRGRERYRERERERDRDRKRDHDRRAHDNGRHRDSHRSGRDSGRRDYESSSRDVDRRRSRSRSRSRSVQIADRPASPFRDGIKERKPAGSSNLAKLMDIYGDGGGKSSDGGADRLHPRDSSTEEVIRLGGSTWR